RADRSRFRRRIAPSVVVLVDVGQGESDEDQDRVLVELRATRGDRRRVDDGVGLAVELVEPKLGDPPIALPLEERDLRNRDVHHRSLERGNAEQGLVVVGAEDAREGLDPEIGRLRYGAHALGPEPDDDELLDQSFRSGVMKNLYRDRLALQSFDIQFAERALE